MLYGIKDSMDFTLISNTTDKPILYVDYAQKTDLEFTSEATYAKNKTVKAIRWDSNREGSFKTEMEVFDKKWLSLLLGATATTASVPVFKREILAVAAGGAGTSLAETPDAGSLVIYKCSSLTDKTFDGVEQTAGVPGTTENTYSIATKALTFNASTFTSAGFIVATYLYSSSKAHYHITATDFPGSYSIMGNTYLKAEDDSSSFVQYKITNCKPKSNMSVTFDVNSVAKVAIDWEIFPDATTGDLMTYIEL